MRKIRQKRGFVAYAIKHHTISDWHWVMEVYDERADPPEYLPAYTETFHADKLDDLSQTAKVVVCRLAEADQRL